MPIVRVWAHVASNQFLYESTETPSKTCRSRKFLIANPCRRHGHDHRSGLGRACTRSVLIGSNRIAIQKISVPKIFDKQSMPPLWTWSSFGFGPILLAINFYMSPAESLSAIFRSRKFLIAKPYRRHAHAHRSGVGPCRKQSVFIWINRNAIQNLSVPKIFDSQSMPPPRACPSLGFGPLLHAISSYRNHQNRHPKKFGPENFW